MSENDPNGGTGNDQLNEIINQKIAEATKGLMKNRDELKDEKTKLQSQLNELKQTWDGLDPEQVKSLMTRMQNDEETKLIAEGKVDEVINRRTEAMKGDFQKRIEASEKFQNDLTAERDQLQNKVKNLMLDSEVRRAAGDLGILNSAIDDALYRAKDIFSIDGDNVVAKDRDGSVKLGKDGKTPLTPSEWIDSMKDSAPHWFGASSGGGAQGGAGNNSSGFTITRSDAKNPRLYQQAKAQAQQAGKPLQIIDS